MNSESFTPSQLIDLTSTSINSDDLKAFAAHENFNIRVLVAGNKKCPADVLNILVDDKNEFVAARAYLNHNLPAEGLKKLATDKRVALLSNVIYQYWDQKSEFVEALLSHPNSSIRLETIITCPIAAEQLHKLASVEKNYKILHAIAAHNSVSSETLTLLSTHWSEDVIMKVAYNPKTPVEVLVKLLQHNQVFIRNAVLENPSLPEKYVKEYIRKVENPETFNSLLAFHNLSAEDYNILIARANTFITDVLDKTNFYSNLAVSEAVPSEILEWVVLECDIPYVITLASENKINPETFNKIYEKFVVETFHLRLANTLAYNPHTPAQILGKLHDNFSTFVNNSLILNPSLPLSIVQKIYEQPHGAQMLPIAEQLWEKDPQYKDFPQDWVEAHFGVQLPKQ